MARPPQPLEATLALLFITGYQGLAQDQRGYTVQAGMEPAVYSSTISFTTATINRTQLLTFSSAVNALFYRVHTDSIAHYIVGTASTISGAITDKRMVAGQTEFFGVDRAGLWISAVAGV